MSILLIGANGGVGSRLVQQLKSDNIDFTAGVRKEEQVKEPRCRCNVGRC